MAKKSNRNSRRSRGMKKIQPSVMTFNIPLPRVTTERTKFLDLSQISSILNRRFMRQGLNWAVAGFTLHTTAGSGSLDIAKIPSTWSVSNGWHKAFAAWNKQQMDAIEEAGAESAVAKFRDFKIFADIKHVSNGFGNNLMPGIKDATALLPGWVTAAPGEWEPSEIVVPNIIPPGGAADPLMTIDPAEYLLHMVGVNNNGGTSRGIVEGYADSRAYPQSPDPVSPPIESSQNWLRDMFDVGNDTSEITENATSRNDNLPYLQVEYPNGEVQIPGLDFHDTINITTTTVSGKSSAKGGNFPCGLIRIKYDSSLGATEAGVFVSVLQVNLVPGHHKGYLCEPMQDM